MGLLSCLKPGSTPLWHEDEIQNEIARLQRARRRDRILNFTLVLMINFVLIASLYFFTPTRGHVINPSFWPSSLAYQLQPEIFFSDRMILQPASPDPILEDMLWSQAISVENAYVWIENAEDLNLPPGLPGGPLGESKLYGLSWAHQIHCLRLVRNEYRDLLHNASRFIYGAENLDAQERQRFHHIDHCFHYLRENIRCSRDMTLEWAAEYPDELGRPHHIDGYGISHQCRSEDWVNRFTASHQPKGGMPTELQHHHDQHNQHARP